MDLSMNPVSPPVIIPTVKEYDFMRVNVLGINLGINATFSVQLYNAAGTFVDGKNMLMDGEDYQKWTTDDYVYEWVNAQLHK